jgi:tripartite-type tricarboxylate transporter receptor subunit TctC
MMKGITKPMMKFSRTVFLGVFSLALMVPASAQPDPAAGYPNKPIHFILGFAAGGGTDLLARIVGPKLSDILGQPVVIENRTGAGGRIAVDYVQSQPADGHTVLIGAIGQLAVATAIYPGKLSFHPTRTLMPITMLGSYPLVLIGPPGERIKTAADLIAYGKANPDKANYPSSSPAFTIASELFKLKTGMPGQLIPYRSTNEMTLSVVGGQTLFAFPDSGIVVPMAQGGKVRALAVGQGTRIPELPDTPSLPEAGLGAVDLKTQWIGAFLPASAPAQMAKKLETALRQALTDAGVRDKIRGITYFPEGGTADEFRERIDGDIQIFSDVVKAANLKFEQ